MKRIEICKNIIQSIKDYITNPTMIEAHRVKNHFVRNRKLTMLETAIDELVAAALKVKSQIQPDRSSPRPQSLRHRRTHFRNRKVSL